MSPQTEIIAANVERVRERIGAAARRSGRSPEEVRLVAVTKYVGVAEVRALLAAGCHDLAESRPQKLWHKTEELTDAPIRWHLVGHLQRNKVRKTIPLVSLLHSGDSERLLAALSAANAGRKPFPVLLEFNVSGDTAKHGLNPQEAEPLLLRVAQLPGIQIRGLMAMAAFASTGDTARRDFVALRELRDRLRSVAPASVTLDELSMGMSRDFETAIEEGATLVRVGSALFEGLSE